MICKWCGNKMASSDTKCKRCGKEAPALSDCGGFYDIVSQESIAAASSAPVNNTVNHPVYTYASAPAPVKKSADNPTIKLVKLALTGFVLVIIIALLVSVFVLTGKVNDLEEELGAQKEKSSTVEENKEERESTTDGEATIKKPTEESYTNPSGGKNEEGVENTAGPVKLFDTDDIKSITFIIDGKQRVVPDDDIEEITEWLETFTLLDEKKSPDSGFVKKCNIKIEYQGKSEKNGILEVNLKVKQNYSNNIESIYLESGNGKSYKLKYDTSPECFIKIISDND